jgi:hypothetical protein
MFAAFMGLAAALLKGKSNGMYRHGLYTREAIEERRFLRELLRQSRQTLSRL